MRINQIIARHDRRFLDNVVTSTLVFEGDGVVTEHAGGYTDWRNELARIAVAKRTAAIGTASKSSTPAKAAGNAPAGAKLNNKERKELETLPGKIEQLEAEQAQITVQLGDPEIYKDGGTKAKRTASLQQRLQQKPPPNPRKRLPPKPPLPPKLRKQPPRTIPKPELPLDFQTRPGPAPRRVFCVTVPMPHPGQAADHWPLHAAWCIHQASTFRTQNAPSVISPTMTINARPPPRPATGKRCPSHHL